MSTREGDGKPPSKPETDPTLAAPLTPAPNASPTDRTDAAPLTPTPRFRQPTDPGSDPTDAAPLTPRPRSPSRPETDPTEAAPLTPRPRTPSGNDQTAAASEPSINQALLAAQASLAIVSPSNYDVLGEFGRGGLGRVLRARDRRTGRIVAIKEALRSSPGLVARFAREALVTANLQHPAIVPVYEVGRWPNGEPFYAMKLVAGRALADAVREAKSLRDRLELLQHIGAVADALAYAHGEHVIHRDLKPANVLIGDYGETVVIDWGLAKRLGDAGDTGDELSADSTAHGAVNEGETAIGSVLGTPGYMAPEQARGEPADERADVYAIGAMLYEVLSSARPYSDSREAHEMLERNATKPPRPLAEVAPDLPRELVAIVERAMAFSPDERYPTAKQLAEDLRRFQTGQLVGAHQYTAWQLFARWVRKHAAAVAASVLGFIVLTIVVAVGIVRIRDERDRANVERHGAMAARSDAMKAHAEAMERASALAAEHGRRLVMNGDAARALPYFAAAVEHGTPSAALRFALARALEQTAPLEAVMLGGAGPLTSVAWSPDGTQVAVAAGAGEVSLWDTREHRKLRVLGPGNYVSWSPDGASIVMAAPSGEVTLLGPDGARQASFTAPHPGRPELSRDGALIAVPTQDGQLVVHRRGAAAPFVDVRAHQAEITEVAFSADGAFLAAASADRSVTVWQLATAKKLATLAHGEHVRDVTFSPDGKHIVTADKDANVRMFDTLSGKQVGAFVGHTNSVESLGFDRDGKHLLTGSADRSAGIWDVATRTRIATLPVGFNVHHAQYTPDGTAVLTVSDRGDLNLWSLQGERIGSFAGHVGAIGSVAFSRDDKRFASVGVDGDIRLWRLDTARTVVTMPNDGTVSYRGEWSPDGKYISITALDGIGRIYDGTTGALVHQLRGHTAEIMRVAFSPDSQRIATASVDGTTRIWDVAAGTQLLSIDPALEPKLRRARFVAYSHDGTRLVTTHDDGTARTWNAATGAALATLTPSRGKPRIAVWSPDDTRIVTPLDGPGATLFDASGKLLGEAELGGDRMMNVDWAPDGAWFVLVGFNTLVRTFDGRTAARIHDLVGHTSGPVMSAQVFADGRVVTSGAEGVVRIWRDGKQVLSFGEGAYPTNGALSPDGAFVSTADVDAKVWDTVTGELVGELRGPRDASGSAFTESRWSPDGQRLLLLTGSTPPKLWHMGAWRGTHAELAQRLRCNGRWRLDPAMSTLVLQTPDPSACR